MSSLGLGHHNNPQNLRISPKAMSTLSPQQMSIPPNMRLSPPQQQQQQPPSGHQPPSHSNGPPTMTPHNLNINVHRQSPASNLQQLSTSGGSTTSSGVGSLPLSSPQNLSISPSSQGMKLTTPTSATRMSSVSPQEHISMSPDNSVQSQKSAADLLSDQMANNNSSGSTNILVKESALNMTMNNSDMRSNSIATLRIKAKEHLESINKGLTMV